LNLPKPVGARRCLESKAEIIRGVDVKLTQLLFLSVVLSTHCVWASEPDPLAGIDELELYIHTAKTAQTAVYRMLDHCAQELPDKRELFEDAKAQWDARNLRMVNSVREVASSWFRSAGLPPESVKDFLAGIDSIAARSEADRPGEKAIAVLAALQPVERRRRCGVYAGFVIGGGLDVQRLVPQALEFLKRYAPLE
jgi:hypothetical protein